MHPQTDWGVKCFLSFLSVVSTVINSRIFALLSRLNQAIPFNIITKTALPLPDQSLFEPRETQLSIY
ncbi:hypothetical protein PSHT_11433 [Puccinia striiformis]|uniref:Uncharacterized protein n=1 Tax=Puccinia striiformis TaxID=27350 RepID=A0A2S4V366_9BASI|nr:hypothetical protein PSHT_11433 [Puccinia striiformis]